MISTRDLEKLAGLLEGEGCFSTRKERPQDITIQINMTDRDVIEWVAVHFGSHVGTMKRQRPAWHDVFFTQIGATKAAQWMMTLYPLMLSQRRKARMRELLIHYRSKQSKSGYIKRRLRAS